MEKVSGPDICMNFVHVYLKGNASKPTNLLKEKCEEDLLWRRVTPPLRHSFHELVGFHADFQSLTT